MNNNVLEISSRFYLFTKKLFLKFGFRLFLTLVSLVFVVYSIIKNSNSLLEQSLNSNSFLFICVSILFTVVSIFVNGIAWKFLLNWLGYDLRKLNLIDLFVRTNLFKYTPGGIWHFIARIRTIKNRISFSRSLIAVFLEPFLMIVAACLLTLFGDWDLRIKLVSLSSLIIFDKRFRNLLLWVLKKIISTKLHKSQVLKKSIEVVPDLIIDINNYPYKALLIEMGFIFLRFLGFWFSLHVFSMTEKIDFFVFLNIFSLAWVIGLIVPGAPGGVGIFESSFLILTGDKISQVPLISALICYRLVSTISDVLAYTIVRFKNYSVKI